MKNGSDENTFKIERGIKVPPPASGRHMSPLSMAIQSLKVGESVFAITKRPNLEAKAYSYIGAGKYAIRAEANGFRVWRIK